MLSIYYSTKKESDTRPFRIFYQKRAPFLYFLTLNIIKWIFENFFSFAIDKVGLLWYNNNTSRGLFLWEDCFGGRIAQNQRNIFGGYYERKNHPRLHRVQAEKLRNHEEQEERSRSFGNEQVLPVLPQAHPSQGNEVK